MDTLFFHPRLVHVPMALGVLMPLVAGGLLLAWWRGWLPSRAWLLAVGLQALLVLSGVMGLRSGEAEEERVEKVVAERFIEAHEEAAKLFVLSGAAALALMLLGAVLAGRKAGMPLAVASAVATLAVAALAVRTGQAGGGLVYEHGAAAAYARDATSPPGTPPAPDDD